MSEYHKLPLTKAYIEWALPLQTKSTRNKEIEITFDFDGKFTSADMIAVMENKQFGQDFPRTPYTWVINGGEIEYSNMDSIKEDILQTGLTIDQKKALAVNSIICSGNHPNNIIQGGHCGAIELLKHSLFDSLIPSLNPGIGVKDDSLCYRNKFTVNDQSNLLIQSRSIFPFKSERLEGDSAIRERMRLAGIKSSDNAIADAIVISFNKTIKINESGGFSYEIDGSSFSLKIKSIIWNFIIAEAILALKAKKSLDNKDIIACAPFLSDARYAKSFFEHPYIQGIKADQAKLLIDAMDKLEFSAPSFISKPSSRRQEVAADIKIYGFLMSLAFLLVAALFFFILPATSTMTVFILPMVYAAVASSVIAGLAAFDESRIIAKDASAKEFLMIQYRTLQTSSLKGKDLNSTKTPDVTPVSLLAVGDLSSSRASDAAATIDDFRSSAGLQDAKRDVQVALSPSVSALACPPAADGLSRPASAASGDAATTNGFTAGQAGCFVRQPLPSDGSSSSLTSSKASVPCSKAERKPPFQFKHNRSGWKKAHVFSPISNFKYRPPVNSARLQKKKNPLENPNPPTNTNLEGSKRKGWRESALMSPEKNKSCAAGAGSAKVSSDLQENQAILK